LSPLAALPNITPISLQRGYGTDQIPAAPFQLHAPELDTGPDAFLDTAAVMANLDLVITTDTAIAHLAGALARPVWVALNATPDWRWLLEREDSPWYPTMRLFRQTDRNRGWDPVVAEMAHELTQLAGGAA
jgi:ADP-heptose:LPS heptosyltransferase